jgi:hypothetical protein
MLDVNVERSGHHSAHVEKAAASFVLLVGLRRLFDHAGLSTVSIFGESGGRTIAAEIVEAYRYVETGQRSETL